MFQHQYFLFLLFLSVFTWSCYEQKEGCLDVLATNFQLDADVDCCRKNEECCCQYPKLITSIKHEYDGTNLASGRVYHTESGQPFFIQSIRFLVSGIKLQTDDREISIIDSLEIIDANGQLQVVPNDFTVFSSASFSYTIGDFTEPGDYTDMHFLLGLGPSMSTADPNQFDADHPLGLGSASIRDSIGDLLLYDIAWIPDTISMEVEHLQAKADHLIPISVPLEGSKPAGASITIPLVIDYTKWFNKLDLALDPIEVRKQKILDGMVTSFSIL